MTWDPKLQDVSTLSFSGGAGGLSKSGSVEQVIESFEAIFISQLVRGLREAFTDGDGDGGGFGKGTYMAWFDQAVSEALAREGGLGLKTQLQRWIQPEPSSSLYGGAGKGEEKR